ncbi:MAG TPA: DNA ligase D [Acetobacteraceae bacterium]|nr:DNA ligase D [Acetobacteraceae bacterium]
MASRATKPRDTSIATYRARRDFRRTPEPAARAARAAAKAPIFVVQKHAAHRAGLHWDFRLEHAGVLWSWAVRKGPSMDTADKRLAAHVEDHPLDYAGFAGEIPEGEYGAGAVAIWDRGTWEPVGDPEAGMQSGEIKFVLRGSRLQGGFVLVRMKPRGRERGESWLLIKERDGLERHGADAAALEKIPLADPRDPPATARAGRAERSVAKQPASRPGKTAARALQPEPPGAKPSGPRRARGKPKGGPPAEGAVAAPLPEGQSPELATLADAPPDGGAWISEIKFDGYRLLAFKHGGKVRLMTRNGLDWTRRFPTLAAALENLPPADCVLDGELVALRADGVSDFPRLQQALSEGHDERLVFYAFDLLYVDGWDLRPCALVERKRLLRDLAQWGGTLRYSDHVESDTAQVRKQACAMGLEGIICKRGDAPYRAGRGRDWLKVKCQGREEFIVIGWTPPAGSRTGIGALHLAFHDEGGALHYVGGVGTGFSDRELAALRRRLDALAADPPPGLLLAGDPPDKTLRWVRPELVAEVQYVGWSGAGRLRHAVYLGLREDKDAAQVVRPVPDPELARRELGARNPGRRIVSAAPPGRRRAAPDPAQASRPVRIVGARSKAVSDAGAVHLTHPERELWPGVTKQDLAEYWRVMAPRALPGLADRPLALVRCPDGIDGQHFFQKHGHKGLAPQLHEGEADGQPYLALHDADGLIACVQMAAIELHAWGATEADPLHPDRLVFDLDPGEGVDFSEIVAAALEVRQRLKRLGLESFCRTTGGKGLHVVAPLRPQAGWDRVKPFAQAFARAMEADSPERFVSTVPKARRRGRILVDWLRNGLGATAVASYAPRARPGAGVATPLAWREVTPKLDPATFHLRSVPDRVARQKRDPWDGFAETDQVLPEGGD